MIIFFKICCLRNVVMFFVFCEDLKVMVVIYRDDVGRRNRVRKRVVLVVICV